MKKNNVKKIMWIIWSVALVIATYFLLPYVFQILQVKSVVVMTGSMTHFKQNQEFFESVWKSKGFEPNELIFRKGLDRGDLIILGKPKDIEVGSVVTFLHEKEAYTTHRIYDYNGTHFKDIWDYCVRKNESEIVLLYVKGDTIYAISDPEKGKDADFLYEGPSFEHCSYYWMPVSEIKGKALFVLPKAGLLHYLLYNLRQAKI